MHNCRYVAKSSLGRGTFGQVFECCIEGSEERVAIKVIKNQAAYYHQARVEIGILQLLNTNVDPYDERHIVRLKDFFLHRGHLCLVFEVLSLNLYELIRRNRFRGLSLSLVRVFCSHILEALAVLKESSVIHCDIKPENILLKDAVSGEVKLIDFGSACFRNRTVYTYIQSRFYRSPEVVLGYDYTEAVDAWSLGCVAAELFLGLPLFPAASEHDLLERIVECIGPIPREILMYARHTSKFYGFSSFDRNSSAIRLLSAKEFEALNMRKAPKGKQYFDHNSLADIINAYPMKSGLSDAAIASERENRESFTDFLLGLLDLNPNSRWTPLQALKHPFIAGTPFKGPYQPEQDATRLNVSSTSESSASEQWQGTIPVNTSVQYGAIQIPMKQAMAASQYTPYVPAHSLQRIVNYPGSYSKARIEGGSQFSNPGSLPFPEMTPPSRSFGARMEAQSVVSEPMPSSSSERVVPLMELPVAGEEPTFQGSFEPSSVGTFRSHIADWSGKGQRSTAATRKKSLEMHREKAEDIECEEDPGDWNPLWKYDELFQQEHGMILF